jgi:hypothetical protein
VVRLYDRDPEGLKWGAAVDKKLAEVREFLRTLPGLPVQSLTEASP